MSSHELAIERMCELAGVSRRSFYRFDPDPQPAERAAIADLQMSGR